MPPPQKFATAFDELPIPFVTRKAPLILAFRLFMIGFVFEGLYLLWQFVGGELFAEMPVSGLGVFAAFAAIQLGLAIWVILKWYTETYEIHRDDIHHNRGILFRREQTYPYNNMQEITVDQGPIGRIYHYGDVRLFIPTLGRDLVFHQIPHPHHFVQTVRHVMPYPDKQKFIIAGS